MASPISAKDPSKVNFSKAFYKKKAYMEKDHQLEKLEFALAISETRGDNARSAQLREEIENLGGNKEEPGT